MEIHWPILFQRFLEGAENLSPIAFWTTHVDLRMSSRSEAGIHSVGTHKTRSAIRLEVSPPSPLFGLSISREVGHLHISPRGSCKSRSVRLFLVTSGADSFISSVEEGAERRCHESISA